MPRRRKDRSHPVPLYLVDTNIIIRFLVGDDPPNAARAAALMSRVETGETQIEVSEAVLTETVWTLQSFYEINRTEIREKLAAMLTFRGCRLDDREAILEAMDIYANSSADFVDCLLASRSKLGSLSVYTFDETDFKRLRVNWERP